MDLQLKNKRALIVGGSGGIGKPIAATLAGEGARIAIAGHRIETVAAAASDLEALSATTVAHFAFDIREDESTAEMIAQAAESLGGIDILVNTGTPQDRGMLTWDRVDTRSFRSDMNLKALGYLRCAQRVAPYMIEQGWGRIVNVGGINVRRSSSVMGAVRNAAVAAVTKQLADVLGPHGINVTVVHPGSVSTEREPRSSGDANSIVGRNLTGTELSYVVAFLCSPRSVAVTGDAINVGGGLKDTINY